MSNIFLVFKQLKLNFDYGNLQGIDMVPGAGIEPARPLKPQDFKSCVSTNFTTRAKGM